VDLLDSQLATLEPLATDEPGVTLDATPSPETVVDKLVDVVPVTI
jgi:gluconokinase